MRFSFNSNCKLLDLLILEIYNHLKTRPDEPKNKKKPLNEGVKIEESKKITETPKKDGCC